MKIKESYVLREICGEKVLSEEGIQNVNMSKFIRLNESAAFLVESVGNGDFTPESLAKKLCARYDVTEETALADAENLCKVLMENGIAE